jgi:hypothetical protein
VAVLGSLARGEAALADVDDRLELFSDIELLVVTEQRWPADRRTQLTASVRQLATGFGYRSRRFHVDLLLRERRRLAALPPFVFTYELRAAGRTLWGRELLPEVRRVTLANLDRRNTHEILVKRLWHLAEDLPRPWIDGQPLGQIAARDLGVALTRHPLDLTTALLPDAGILCAGYGARVAAWQAVPDWPLRQVIDKAIHADSSAWLADCLARRARAEPAQNAAAEHRRASTALEGGLAGLLGTDRADVVPALCHGSGSALRPLPATPGEWAALARQCRRIARARGLAVAAHWLAMPRKGRLAAGLVLLHRSLAAWQGGDVEEALALAKQAAAQGRTVGEPGVDSVHSQANWIAAWLDARHALARAFWRVYRLGEGAAWRHLAASLAAAD